MSYRGCWHGVSRSFKWYRHHRGIVPSLILPHSSRSLHPEGFSSFTRRCWVGLFRPLPKIPDCCLPWESDPYVGVRVADRPLRPATDRRLGKPLPYQQANPPQAPLQARGSKSPALTTVTMCGARCHYAVLAQVSTWVIPHPKVDYLRVTHPCATLLIPRRELSRSTCMSEARRQR